MSHYLSLLGLIPPACEYVGGPFLRMNLRTNLSISGRAKPSAVVPAMSGVARGSCSIDARRSPVVKKTDPGFDPV